jgi:hypothetical protein
LTFIRKELNLRFVGAGVGTRNLRSGGDQARQAGSLLAVSLCLAVGLLLITGGVALGISGYSSGQSAVLAQYPDATSLNATAPKPAVSSLGDVLKNTHKILRTPKARARWRAKQRTITRNTKHALATAAGLEPPQSGSIALLLAGMAVILVGVFLRWRRGLTHTS